MVLVILGNSDGWLVITGKQHRFSKGVYRMSLRNILIQMASLAVWVIATYSDSVVDNEMRACFLEFQETALSSMQNVYPEIACQCSCELPSASLYPSMPSWFLHLGSSHVSTPPLPSINLASCVPFKYCITLLTASQCACPGFTLNCARYDMA